MAGFGPEVSPEDLFLVSEHVQGKHGTFRVPESSELITEVVHSLVGYAT